MNNCKNCKMTDEYYSHDKTNYDILKDYETHQTPVPSYDKWRTLKLIYEYCPTREKYIMKLEIKNAQLKELLKECKDLLKRQPLCRNLNETDVELRDRLLKKQEIITKIYEVLR